MCSVVDAAHVPFAHHGSGQGDRNKLTMNGFKKVKPGVDGAFSAGIHSSNTVNTLEYIPPCHVGYAFGAKEEGADPKFALFTMTAPAGRGKVRALTSFALVRPPKFVRLVLKLIPRWWHHTRANLILDSDAVLLRGQERYVQVDKNDGFGGAWKDGYFCANGTWDGPVVYLRKWIDAHAGSMPWETPPAVPSVGEELSRESIIERFNSHTKDCKSCLGALKKMRVLRVVAAALGLLAVFTVISAVVAQVAVGRVVPGLVKLGVGNGIVALVALALFAFCSKYIPLLLYSNIGHELATGD